MGILAAKRFKENYKASGGPYKGQGYREIANNKIKSCSIKLRSIPYN